MNTFEDNLHHITSQRDEFTGLYTRSYVEGTLKREVVRAEAYGRSVSVVMIDLDHFEQFTGECGEAAGGILLQVIAQLIQSQTRPTDFTCRYRHSEFAIVMPQAPSNVARQRAERFRTAIRSVGWCHNESLSAPVTVSAGVASFPDHATDMPSLLQAAEAALQRATQAGRDRVMVASVSRPAVD
jgi:diguanylate cyclase (GGDEF)-like protein